jgi:cobalt-zinc-cadmium efflux system protein
VTTKPGFSTHGRVRNRRRLLWTLLLTGAAFIAEAIGGFLTNSLALLSDAGHMFTHLLALGVSYLAVLFSERPATERRTYGLNRLEILAALFNGATLFAISIGISYEAYRRLLEPLPIATGSVLVIAVVGLLVNLIGAVILSGAEQKDLNVRGAFMHLLTDTFSSVAVIVGVAVISVTGWTVIDPLLSVVICVVILFWAFRLVWDSVDILLEATPRDVNMQDVVQGLRQIPGIRDVHHLHVWSITSGMYALSAHVDVDDLRVSDTERLAHQAEAFLKDRFNINHTTFQFECRSGRTVDEVLSGIRVASSKEGTGKNERDP